MLIPQAVERADAEQTAAANMGKRVAAVVDVPTVLSVEKRDDDNGDIWYVEKRAAKNGGIWSVEKREDEDVDLWYVEKRAPLAAKLEQPK